MTLKVRERHYIRFQLDSGADCNVMPIHAYMAATGDEQLLKVVFMNAFIGLWSMG